MSVGPKVKWIKDKYRNYNNLLRILLLSILINLFILYFFKSYSLISNFIIISSIFLIISSAIDLYKYSKNKNDDASRIVSHISFGFLVLFIGLNYNFSYEKDFNLKIGEKKFFNNYSLEFKDLQLKDFQNYKSIIGEFKINNAKGNLENFLYPEIRIYENPSTLTYEASIRTGLFKDYYITMSNIDRSDYYNIKFQKKPFMMLIWVSVIFVSLGGFMRVFKSAKKNY